MTRDAREEPLGGAGAAEPSLDLPLSLDLYELTMAQSYFAEGMDGLATFSLFARHLPRGWGYFIAAGLNDVLRFLEAFAFTSADLAYLRSAGLFTSPFVDFLGQLRFSGSVCALPEGTACFPDEPLVEVTAPIVEAQLVETVVLNLVHFQTIVATKAARCVEAARGRRLVDFSLRRTHSPEAGLMVARSSYLAGFGATSNVLAGRCYGIPTAGTMAHSYIQAFGDELTAFRAFARAYPDGCVLLVDTFDSLEGTRRAALVGQEMAATGHRLRGIRLDSGDLIDLSFKAREILDAAGLTDVTIFASGSLDEHVLAEAVARGAPIDAFGVGSRLGTSADAPYLDMAYKLVEYDGRPTLKLSTHKATWPGAKQVWRARADDGEVEDVLGLADEAGPLDGRPLLVEVMHGGRRLVDAPLATIRERARQERESLPADLRSLDASGDRKPRPSQRLLALRDSIVARQRSVTT